MEITTFLYYIPILVVLYIIFKSYFFQKSPKGPPSPATCLPIIGHFHILREPFHKTFANLADRYGPILSLRFGSRLILLVSSTSAVEECLAKNDIIFCNRPSGFLTVKHIVFDYTSLIWAPYGAHWRNLRRISTIEIFSSHRLKLLAPMRAEEVKIMIQRVYKQICGSSSKVELKPLMYYVAMNVMTKAIFGKRYYGVDDEEGKKFREMMDKFIKLFNELCIGDMIPCLRWLDWGKARRLRKFDVERGVILKELVKEHREMIKVEDDNGNEECKEVVKPLIQVLLRLQELEPDYYKDEIIFGIILDLLIGSSDTSAETMEWTLSLLLNHPRVLNKAKTEIRNHVGFKRLLEESDLSHLPYLRCIINETLRMYPPAPFLVPHESSEDCVVGGYHIPRGTMLQINLWAIQNDPNIWGDPTIFRPERFEGVEGHKIGYKMMPFGSGRRSCPGEGLATRVIGLTIGSIIQCFELERISHEPVNMAKADGFNMMKAEPLRAMVCPWLAMTKLLDQI